MAAPRPLLSTFSGCVQGPPRRGLELGCAQWRRTRRGASPHEEEPCSSRTSTGAAPPPPAGVAHGPRPRRGRRARGRRDRLRRRRQRRPGRGAALALRRGHRHHRVADGQAGQGGPQRFGMQPPDASQPGQEVRPRRHRGSPGQQSMPATKVETIARLDGVAAAVGSLSLSSHACRGHVRGDDRQGVAGGSGAAPQPAPRRRRRPHRRPSRCRRSRSRAST